MVDVVDLEVTAETVKVVTVDETWVMRRRKKAERLANLHLNSVVVPVVVGVLPRRRRRWMSSDRL